MRRTTSTPRRATVLALALSVTALAGLTSCSDTEAPLGSSQWQISAIYDTQARGGVLPDSQQGRSFLIFGEDSLNGTSGCMHMTGNVAWKDEGMRISGFSSSRIDGAQCLPGDEDTADRLKAVLNDQDLTYTRPAENSLKLQQSAPKDKQDWQSVPAVEFISGPKEG